MLKLSNKLIFIIFTFLITNRAYSDYNNFVPLTDNQIHTIINSPTRVLVNLSGNWERSYNESDWEQVSVPCSENFQSNVSYKKSFTIDKNNLNNFSWNLYFLGIEDEVKVFVNDRFLGIFFSGMTPLNIKIPEKTILHQTVEIKLSFSQLSPNLRIARSHFPFQRKTNTGIIREVYLVGTPHVRTSSIQFKYSFNQSLSDADIKASINISATEISKIFSKYVDSVKGTNNLKVNLSIEAIIKKKTGETVAQSGIRQFEIESERTIIHNINMTVNSLQLWSPESPNLYLYTVKISRNGALIDEFTESIGFRDIKVKNYNNKPTIFLNNHPFELKGTEYIEDYYYTGQSLSAERMEQDIQIMKTLGINAINFKFSPPHPYFAELCDKYGLVMLIDLPVYCLPKSVVNLDEIRVKVNNSAKQILQSYDLHPSAFGYGIASGLQENSHLTDEFINSIIAIFRKSSANLIYKIIFINSKTCQTDNFDLIGIHDQHLSNNYIAIRANLQRLSQQIQSKPFFITYGIPIDPNNHNGYLEPLSIESQADYVRNYNYIIRDFQCSSFYSTFNDYQLENPFLITGYFDQYICTSGLVDRFRQPRLAYNVLQTFLNQEKEPILNPGSQNTGTPLSFILIGFFIAIVMVFMINRFRRFREYLFRSILRPYNFYADIRDQRIMSTFQTTILGAVFSITLGVYFSSIFTYYKYSIVSQDLYMIIFPSTFIQEILFKIVYMPEVLILVLSLFFFSLAFLLASALRVFSFLVKSRIIFYDTLTIIIWSAVPFLLLLPLAIVLYRLLVFAPSAIWFIILSTFISGVWVWLRILRSTGVVFDVHMRRVYIVGWSLFGIFLFTILIVADMYYSVFSYMQYFISVFSGT
ncbi:MAG: hypothetical protein NT007_14820 [Candidatus Kapabacteria bacterium]|nr:hypothetical protein [Candidatus Kapabacteria bacterium]